MYIMIHKNKVQIIASMTKKEQEGINSKAQVIMKTATFMDILIIELIRSFANLYVVPTLWQAPSIILHINYKTTDTNQEQDMQLRTITAQYEKHMITGMFGSTYERKWRPTAELEGWGGINHAKGQVGDEEQGVGGKQLKNPEESIQRRSLYKKSEDERGHRTSESNNNNKILDGLTGNVWREER